MASPRDQGAHGSPLNMTSGPALLLPAVAANVARCCCAVLLVPAAASPYCYLLLLLQKGTKQERLPHCLVPQYNVNIKPVAMEILY